MGSQYSSVDAEIVLGTFMIKKKFFFNCSLLSSSKSLSDSQKGKDITYYKSSLMYLAFLLYMRKPRCALNESYIVRYQILR